MFPRPDVCTHAHAVGRPSSPRMCVFVLLCNYEMAICDTCHQSLTSSLPLPAHNTGSHG